MVHLWTDYYATAVAETIKQVTCEHCGQRYHYLLKMGEMGHAYSEGISHDPNANTRARNNARFRLEKELRLARKCRLVPCPNCGRYQKNMVLAAKKRWQSFTGLGLVCLLVTVPLYLTAGQMLSRGLLAFASEHLLVVALTFAGVGLVLFGVVMELIYTPNWESLESRKRLGRKLTLTLSQLEALHRRSSRPTLGALTMGDHVGDPNTGTLPGALGESMTGGDDRLTMIPRASERSWWSGIRQKPSKGHYWKARLKSKTCSLAFSVTRFLF